MGGTCSAQVQAQNEHSRGLKTGSAFALQAAFADINIHKSRSVYYWFGGGDQHGARRCVERRDGEYWLGPTRRRDTDVKRTKGRSASCK